MASINALPQETLHQIMSYLSSDISNLLNCSTVCQSLSEVANAALYRDINLAIEEHWSEGAKEKNPRRQLRLLQTLSENPKLGAYVRIFKNYQDKRGEFKDVTAASDTDSAMLVKAAQNMSCLSEVSLSYNPLAAHIIANLPSYPHLTKLRVCRFQPWEHIWSKRLTSLTSLSWELPPADWSPDPAKRLSMREIATLLINVVEATCPNLVSLDITFGGMSWRKPSSRLFPVPTDIIEGYRGIRSSENPKSKHLQHFGIQENGYRYGSYQPEDEPEVDILDHIARYGDTLTSIAIPFRNSSLNSTLRACRLIPNLKSLTISKFQFSSDGVTSLEFLRRLTASPSTANLERFTLVDSNLHYSATFGQLFRPWKNLKFLWVGDQENQGGPFGQDGRLDCDSYRPELLGFIKALPRSIEEITVEIHGYGLWLDDDEDFDPFCNLESTIFPALTRLHTCNIHAWISNVDGGMGWFPEKAVFYRRFPHDPSLDSDKRLLDKVLNNKVKDIWVSRMDFIYQVDDVWVRKDCRIVNLTEELTVAPEFQEKVFEGKDAKEVWCRGFTSDAPRRATGRGHPPGPDYSWPSGKYEPTAYSGFRRRF